ncbi:MAG: glycosyltransferase family 2 protein [Proteobacteria bacterium]|nr:glycosyltransferase family 2 protein [Pseudomonadota bacterium]
MDKNRPKISVIIPVLNEQDAIGLVIRDIPKDVADEVIVVDNGSTDNTARAAQMEGARVVLEPHRGYGAACLKGIASAHEPDIVVFLDGDFSDYPEEMARIVAPIVQGTADLVIGSRISGGNGRRVLLPQAYFGNKLAAWLIDLLYHHRFTDLGPFRAIRCSALKQLDMRDRNFGWTIEMQVKAVKQGLSIIEVPVRYRPRIGKSKVSGTLSGSIKAGVKILYTVFSHIF